MHLVWSYNRLCRPSALEYMPSFRYGHIYTCMIKIPIEIGDIVRVGRFKNKRIEVKTIEYDEYGLPRVNGRPLLTMRIEKLMPAKTMESMRLSTLIPESVVHIDKAFNAELMDAINDEYHEDYTTLTPMEINDGYCDIWANQFTKRFGGQHQWSFDFPDDANGHSWVKRGGKYYDAEIPEGVTHMGQIPYFQRAIKRIGNAQWIDLEFRRNIQTSGTSPCE